MTTDEINERLSSLSPEIPWAHMFEFAPGIFSITEDNEKFFKKATGLKKVGDILLAIAKTQVQGNDLAGKSVLDLACGEGYHAIQFAEKLANVVGVEGRQLYLDRASFAAETMGYPGVQFVKGDVRKLDPNIGKFDIVVFSGILHHLGIDDFDDMVKELGRLTNDLLLIYTHVSSETSVRNHRLEGPVKTPLGREGFLFREHKDDATAEQREKKVRASLDNTFSFWAREESVVDALKSAGFSLIMKVLKPHPFGWEGASYRSIFIAKKY